MAKTLDTSGKGKWTHRLIPDIELWTRRGHTEIEHYLTQFLTGHGYIRETFITFNWATTLNVQPALNLWRMQNIYFIVAHASKSTEQDWQLYLALIWTQIIPWAICWIHVPAGILWQYVSKIVKKRRQLERERQDSI